MLAFFTTGLLHIVLKWPFVYNEKSLGFQAEEKWGRLLFRMIILPNVEAQMSWVRAQLESTVESGQNYVWTGL